MRQLIHFFSPLSLSVSKSQTLSLPSTHLQEQGVSSLHGLGEANMHSLHVFSLL